MAADLVGISVPGTDREIVATVIDGTPMISLRHACDAIGIDFSSQFTRLKRWDWATVVMTTMVGADGKSREMATIDRRTFTSWLTHLDVKRVNAGARPVIQAFQSEAADALDAYFNEGGAINSRATEDQVGRLSRDLQAKASVLKSLKGLIDPKHLEAKARILMAQAMGEAPEFDESLRPLYVESYLKAKGLRPDLVKAKRGGFGSKLSAEFIKKYDRAPGKHWGEVDGRPREINAYTEADRPLFDKVWAHHYEGVVAEAAFTVIDGGAS